MATRAAQVLPVIDSSRLRPELSRLFVAVAARHRNVAPTQNEVRLFVARERERGGFVRFHRVAALASVEIRSGGKLPGVTVAVAIRAALEFDFE